MSPVVLSVEAKPRGTAAVTLEGAGGVSSCVLPVDTVVLNHVHSGMALEDAEWQRIRAAGQLILATRLGFDLLSRRQRTEQELHRSLARRFGAEAATGALDRLRELGYLDDAAWAKQYVASGASSVRGRALLKQELRQRGVADPLVAEALEDHDDHGAAHRAAMKRVRALRDLDPERRKRRLYDFLRRRGFSDAAARPAMAAALQTLDNPENDDHGFEDAAYEAPDA